MTPNRVTAVANEFPTPSRLIDNYNNYKNNNNSSPNSLADIKCGRNQQKLGSASNVIFYLYNSDKYTGN